MELVRGAGLVRGDGLVCGMELMSWYNAPMKRMELIGAPLYAS
ncbi:hypothetical protein [Bartonella queenslandensis]|nr:hypothetical protein [Bartonella queenslandensis]